MNKVVKYCKNLFIGVDQLLNVIGGGNPDETVSSRLGRIRLLHGGKIKWWRRPLPWLVERMLDKAFPDHCIKSIEQNENPENGVFDRRKP